MPNDSTPREGLREAANAARQKVRDLSDQYAIAYHSDDIDASAALRIARDRAVTAYADAVYAAASPSGAEELSEEALVAVFDEVAHVREQGRVFSYRAWADLPEGQRQNVRNLARRIFALARASGERIAWCWGCDWCDFELRYDSEAARDANRFLMREHSATCPAHPAVIALRELTAERDEWKAKWALALQQPGCSVCGPLVFAHHSPVCSASPRIVDEARASGERCVKCEVRKDDRDTDESRVGYWRRAHGEVGANLDYANMELASLRKQVEEASLADREAEGRDIARKALEDAAYKLGVEATAESGSYLKAQQFVYAFRDREYPLPAPRHPSVTLSDGRVVEWMEWEEPRARTLDIVTNKGRVGCESRQCFKSLDHLRENAQLTWADWQAIGEAFVLGAPAPEDEAAELPVHNCDAMGCRLCHVLFRSNRETTR